jgi:hypothetical protein
MAVANRYLCCQCARRDGHVANVHAPGPSSTFSEPARLVLNKQLDIEEELYETHPASLCVSDPSSEAIASYNHAVEMGT